MKKLFLSKKPLIGMIHLPPMLGFEGYPGLDYCIKKSVRDLHVLEKAGFDGVLIENDDDKPSTEIANSAQIANFAIVAHEVVKKAKIPVGIQVTLNDWKSTIEIATLTKARFIRVDVFVDHVTSKWGEINPDPKKIIAYKSMLNPGLILMTDIQVKHKTLLEDKPLIESARQAIDNGSNVLIISGNATGEETPISKITEVKNAFPEFQVFVGAGLNIDNVLNQLSIADGGIVGTSIKTGDLVNLTKSKSLVAKTRRI